jgi:hypothetical protein
MTVDEVIAIVKKQEDLGLKDAVLMMTKPKSYKQKSEFMMTPFGKARCSFNGERDGYQTFVVFVPVVKMKAWLEKVSKMRAGDV